MDTEASSGAASYSAPKPSKISINDPNEAMPSVEFRLITARYLNELGMHKLTVKVLEMVNCE